MIVYVITKSSIERDDLCYDIHTTVVGTTINWHLLDTIIERLIVSELEQIDKKIKDAQDEFTTEHLNNIREDIKNNKLFISEDNIINLFTISNHELIVK